MSIHIKADARWLQVGLILVLLSHFQAASAFAQPDLYIKDTPADAGIEPNPDAGPMWVSEDIWVRTSADPNFRPQPYPESSPTWFPAAHENAEFRDPHFSAPNYVYVRVRNRGNTASTGNERLLLYWAKASTSLAWPNQWRDNVVTSGGSPVLYGSEITKPRKNAATATQTERDAYTQAVLRIGTAGTSFVYPDGVRYWHKQNLAHQTVNPGAGAASTAHGTPAFFPWHREMLRRYELLLQKADPTVTLLYWDWTVDPASGGFNFFTPTFMGASGRGTGGASIGAPFLPAFAPPAVQRNLGVGAPTSEADGTLLSLTRYHNISNGRGLWERVELTPNHNSAHGYIGGNTATRIGGAEDPFFFLLHGNVDRLWAHWQRDYAADPTLSRLESATAYGNDAMNGNITAAMVPWSGSPGIRPWTAADGHIVSKNSLSRSVVNAPIYDTAPLRIPILQPNQAVVIEIPWFPPDPANFASFGGDQGHFCLLARVETATSAPFGMTTAETADVNANTRNNNNIAWKNITIVDDFAATQGITSFFIRNMSDKEESETQLRFAGPGDFDPSFFDFGTITVDLKPALFERWRASGGRSQGVEVTGRTTVRLQSSQATLDGIRLRPGELFPVDLRFALSTATPPQRGVVPKLDVVQVGAPNDPRAVVGGVRFEFDVSKIRLIAAGSEWRFHDPLSPVAGKWQTVGFDDAKWSRGRAGLGFGNNSFTTIDDRRSDRWPITYYFRRTFEVPDPSFVRDLHLRLRRNDGAVVYLNGTEIQRVNISRGRVSATLRATRDVVGLERNVFFPLKVDPRLLRKGNNVVAVELHLASPRSADADFDLELYANPVDLRHAPDIAFERPAYGSLSQVGRRVLLTAEALDTDGKIAEVQFFADGELVGTDNAPPYSVEWQGPRSGTFQIRAVGYDNDKLATTVSTVITVVEDTPPTVQVLQPQGGAMFQARSAVSLRASASDENGAVRQVDYYLLSMGDFSDPRLVGSATAEPFQATITGLVAGHYMLTAVATDSAGNVSHSIPSHFHVQ